MQPLGRRTDRRAFLGTGLAAGFAAGCASPARARGGVPAAGSAAWHALFSDLSDQSARWQPLTPAEKRPRLARAAKVLSECGADALLVEPGATLRWFSDVRWGLSERLFALVVLADGNAFWILPSFETSVATRRIAAGGPEAPLVSWDEHEYAWEPLAAELRARGVERLVIDPAARAFVVARTAEAFGPARVRVGVDVVRRLRATKDARELELMRGACELTQRAIRAVAERLEPGQSDHELGAWIQAAEEKLGLRDTWCLPLLGPGAAAPHGEPEGRTLAPGLGVLVDTGGALHDYQSDITRSWHFGAQGTDEFVRAWHTVRAAQASAFESMRPGVECRAVDAAARATLVAAGYPGGYEVFWHRLGHGIGLEGHEEPYFDGGNALALEPGMTFSDEPGVYLEGRLGVRIEDIVSITGDGARVLGRWQESPARP
jgi:Xaa-Pro dipeptidase